MTDELRPPEKWEHLGWHFLKCGDSIMVSYWLDKGNNSWWLMAGARVTPDNAAHRGWTYVAPAIPMPDPDDPATVERVARAIDDATRLNNPPGQPERQARAAYGDNAGTGGNIISLTESEIYYIIRYNHWKADMARREDGRLVIELKEPMP